MLSKGIAALAIALALQPSVAQARPGSLISAARMADAPASFQAWRIRYETTDASGRRTEATGVLVSPRGSAGRLKRDVMAWAHPTVGIAEACAPSAQPNVLETIPNLAGLIAQGWVVVATDYPGLGTPGPNAYLVGEAEARSLLDSVRAAQGLAQVGAGRRFGVWGLSQGAHAALFTGEVSKRYAPELEIVGVAAAAPPTDLSANLGGGVNPTVRAALTAFAAQSWSEVYDVDLSIIARPVAQRVIRRLAGRCSSPDPALRTKIEVLRLRRQLRDVDLTLIDPWRGLLRRNSAGSVSAGAPLLIAQSAGDQVVAPAVTRNFVARACSRGEKVLFVAAGDGPHATTASVTAAQTISWFAGRFAGNRRQEQARVAPSVQTFPDPPADQRDFAGGFTGTMATDR
ncbi:alpha/beta fold hydrolase [Rhizobium tropici]|uniref:Alpha/beta fold hydrolase n=1 Tax=Rhizobium tropici TaxID=398 RepID=A0A5B0WIA0_RHITR|nr:lipase family protein [Rhizobium tropici]KAA1185639.1 alpha/beta fold hydrolase [Rhizobium tropici]